MIENKNKNVFQNLNKYFTLGSPEPKECCREEDTEQSPTLLLQQILLKTPWKPHQSEPSTKDISQLLLIHFNVFEDLKRENDNLKNYGLWTPSKLL